MITTLTTTLDNHEKAVLAEARGIIKDLIDELAAGADSVYVNSKNCHFDGDEWELEFLEEIEEVLFSLSESDTLSGS